ncbi:MAG TPA: S26 family signal peptidase [Trueperaceae bacterium]
MRTVGNRKRVSGSSNSSKSIGSRLLREVRGYAEALVIAFLVVTFAFNTVGVVGSSMQPTLDGGAGRGRLLQSLLTGDRVFIPKYETWLRRLGLLGPYHQPGQVVVLREPPNSPTAQLPERQDCAQEVIGLPCRPFLIKRVIAGPGDHLSMVNGQVHLNGTPLEEAHLESEQLRREPEYFPVITQSNGVVTAVGVNLATAPSGITYPILPTKVDVSVLYPPQHPLIQYFYGKVLTSLAAISEEAPVREPFVHEIVVPPDHYFVMGDNRSRGGSEDSRLFGPIPGITIAGRASAVIWPPRRDGQWNWRALRSPSEYKTAAVNQ